MSARDMREACVKHVADAIAACYRRAWTSPDEMRGATGALKRLAVSMANLPLPPAPAPRCPYFSRAWGVQCDRPVGHDGNCQSGGDGFAPGYTPAPNEKMRCSACPEPGSDDRPCDSFVHATPPAPVSPPAVAKRERRTVWFMENDAGLWMGADMGSHTRDPNAAAQFGTREECEAACERDRRRGPHPGDPRIYNPTEHIFFGDDEVLAAMTGPREEEAVAPVAWAVYDKDGAKMLDHPFRSREAAEAVKRECEVWRWPARAPFTLRPLYAAPLPAPADAGNVEMTRSVVPDAGLSQVERARREFYEAARKRGDTWLTIRTMGRGDRAAYEAALALYDEDVARCDAAHSALLAAERAERDAKGGERG